MNKFINALLIFILIPTMLFTIIVAFDIPVSIIKTSGAHIPYRFEIFLGIGLLIFIINLRRTIRRWMGMRVVSRIKKFKWNAPVSPERKKRVITYLILETVVFAFVGVALYVLTPQAWMPAIGFAWVAVDNIIFSLVGLQGDRFRIGLSSKALIIGDREVIVLYFKGLRKVSLQQQSIYFDYVNGMQLTFPSNCIQDENRPAFLKLLEDQLDPDRVFFSKKL